MRHIRALSSFSAARGNGASACGATFCFLSFFLSHLFLPPGHSLFLRTLFDCFLVGLLFRISSRRFLRFFFLLAVGHPLLLGSLILGISSALFFDHLFLVCNSCSLLC